MTALRKVLAQTETQVIIAMFVLAITGFLVQGATIDRLATENTTMKVELVAAKKSRDANSELASNLKKIIAAKNLEIDQLKHR